MNGKTKPSTLFPENWTEKDIINKTIEALLDIEKIEKTGENLSVVGNTIENITIEMYISPKGIIKTYYPIYESI
jgi:hypothetical protein